MTVLGKILTIFLFLFSLVFLGFAVTINQLNKDSQTGKSWRTLVEEFRRNEKSFQDDQKGKSEELAAFRARIGTLTKDLEQARASAAKEVEQKTQQITRLSAEVATLKNNFANIQADLLAATSELERRRNEAVKLYDTIKQKESEIATLQVERSEAKNKETQALVQSASLQTRMQQLEKTTQDLQIENDQLRESLNAKVAGGVPGGRRDPMAKVPPPNDVEGIVKQVSADGLISISIGSDAGLMKGHTLEVFRLNPTKYVGRVVIVETSPHEAVARVTDAKMVKDIQANDLVASRIVKN